MNLSPRQLYGVLRRLGMSEAAARAALKEQGLAPPAWTGELWPDPGETWRVQMLRVLSRDERGGRR